MTEEEARMKWCAHVKFAPDTLTGVSGNRFDGGPEKWDAECRCIASHCMAWREGPPTIMADEFCEGIVLANEFNPPFSNVPDGFEVTSYNSRGWRASKNGIAKATGYCGLAGKP